MVRGGLVHQKILSQEKNSLGHILYIKSKKLDNSKTTCYISNISLVLLSKRQLVGHTEVDRQGLYKCSTLVKFKVLCGEAAGATPQDEA